MKIALLSDIHGNFYAFNKVFEEFEKFQIKEIFILGDIFGYYYEGIKILRVIKSNGYEMVLGNHDEYLIKSFQKKISNNSYSIQKDLQDISEMDISFLKSMPTKIERTWSNKNVLITHNLGTDYSKYFYPDTPIELFPDYSGFQFVFFGHSHRQFIKKKNDVTYINVGSVGQNREKGGIANWVVFDDKSGEVNLVSTKYDVLPLIERIPREDKNYNYLTSVLKRR